MAYTPTNWQNLPNTTTPVNSTNMNKIESELSSIETNLSNIQTDYNNKINELKGTVIYETDNPLTSGSFATDEDVSNYTRLKYFNSDGICIGETLSTATIIYLTFIRLGGSSQGEANHYFVSSRLNRNGDIFTIVNMRRSFRQSGSTNFYQDEADINWVAVAKIIGYKY